MWHCLFAATGTEWIVAYAPVIKGSRTQVMASATRAPAIAEKPRDSFMSVEMLADVWLTQQIAST